MTEFSVVATPTSITVGSSLRGRKLFPSGAIESMNLIDEKQCLTAVHTRSRV